MKEMAKPLATHQIRSLRWIRVLGGILTMMGGNPLAAELDRAEVRLEQKKIALEKPIPSAKTLSPDTPIPDRNTYTPTSEYEPMTREGWQVLVWKGLLRNHPEIAQQTLKLLDYQLLQIRRTLPAAAVQMLQKVRIWVEWEEGHHPCMAYHPSAGWLREHGMNPDKAKCVEIAHARNFLAWTKDQPWMVLHELAHAYHDQFLPSGYNNPEIKAVYEAAMKAGLYQKVLFIRGGRRQAYAARNPMEYFAELTEAYFGTNDFYPFVQGELREYDPAGFSLIEKLWGVREKPVGSRNP
ncbi:MAG: hypothetical protein NZ602_15175 [Thermoguttaceae bacterium]|nr:hypothetical protein [Thermoguttaceae bacterium]MDW8038465.1 hypothetical protein [Thermoguttaceae bacterium]